MKSLTVVASLLVTVTLGLACTGESPLDTATDTATDTDTTETGAPDSGSTTSPTTDASTGGTELPAACEDPDPAVSAAFTLEGPGWLPGDSASAFEADALCDVVSVAVEAAVVSTELACEVDGAPQTATFRIAEAPEGAVAWEAGQSVRLRVDQANSFSYFQTVRLHAADDTLLAVATWGGGDDEIASRFAPLTHEIVAACGESEPTGDDVRPAAIKFGFVEGGAVEIVSAHRASLPITTAEVFAIDVGKVEIGHCCHFVSVEDVVLRRVKTGG
jgi:hypothetical protein